MHSIIKAKKEKKKTPRFVNMLRKTARFDGKKQHNKANNNSILSPYVFYYQKHA